MEKRSNEKKMKSQFMFQIDEFMGLPKHEKKVT